MQGDTKYAGHFISAPWRSSGKSVVSIGLAKCAARRHLRVQTFKKGPDYIDPLWLGTASGNPCYNLDPYIQSTKEIHRLFRTKQSEVTLVEGTMGLHDGLDVSGQDSNASVARAIGLPVLLVVDCRGMHRTIAALIQGLTQFDKRDAFSGVILNRLRSDRHAQKIHKAIEQYCDLQVLGAIAESQSLMIDERELGLVPAPEHLFANAYVESVADAIEESCNVDALLQNNRIQPQAGSVLRCQAPDSMAGLRLGIAQDEAFHFYYADDLNELQARGAQLVPFSPMKDCLPDNLDGLLIGGGFPERYAKALAANCACREQLADAIANGLPVRAECGGLMYLCRTLEVEQVVWPMVGALKATAVMQDKPVGRGYMQLQPQFEKNPMQYAATMPAHEFHHSTVEFDAPPHCLYRVSRGYGLDGVQDGVQVHNLVASYAHLRHTKATPWIDWFSARIQSAQQSGYKTMPYV